MPSSTSSNMKPTCIIIHHSLTEDNQTVSWNAIRNYHINIQKWKDVGYHYGIEKVGDHYEILKGRMDNEEGAHTLGFNDKSIGICLVGNYDHTPPNADQLATLKRLVTSLMEIYQIPRMCVYGHWETYALRKRQIEKTCPGSKFSMASFRNIL